MLTDTEIQLAMEEGLLSVEPFDAASVQPASYDLRVGKWAFASSLREKVDIANRGVLVVEPGEFAVLETQEAVKFGPQVAAQLGLRSEYARRGLLMLSGPQVDPGFEGVLVVRVVNLSPNPVALPFNAPFLTAQLFRLGQPVAHPYRGPRQGQTGIGAMDIQELAQTEGITLGGVIKTLGALAADVKELKGSVKTLSWSIPGLLALGMGIIAIIVGLK